ncbi:MAG: DedA family protein [Elusimicrobia bacterium]|nr:DedA family protein [Elusimicrobiota bacterium]
MQAQFHALLTFWFHFVETQGYLGVFLLMALESSIVPIPSEIIMPPAAYWAAQGRMDFWLVVAAGAAGGLFGSLVCYGVARAAGAPAIIRWGRYILLPPEKVEAAEDWVREYGVGGIFFSRLLPVVRHLISVPAGILRMPVAAFCVATTAGAFLWDLILAWFGRKVIGDQPHLLDSPEQLALVLREKMHLIVLGILALAAAYALMLWLRKRVSARAAAARV